MSLPKPQAILDLEHRYSLQIPDLSDQAEVGWDQVAYFKQDASGAVTELRLRAREVETMHWVSNFPALEVLDLRGTSISKIEGLDTLTSLDSLDLSNTSISKIEGLDTLTSLRVLNLSFTRIGKIESLDALTSLRVLNLSFTRIGKIEGLDALTSLNVLNLSLTSISRIEGLEALTNLNWLDLSRNSISKIEGLDALTNLNSLDLSITSISRIEGLEALTNLNRIDLSDNQIREIEGLEALTNLNWIDLSYNQIRDIEGLKVWIEARREQGGDLRIHANPFLEEIDRVLNDNENHLPYLRDYFAWQEEEKSDYALPYKVMLLGNHQAGKSTFLHRYAPEYQWHGDSTHVLQVHRTTDPDINFYDFGGQDYYHGIYQAFFTLNSLCLLFWRSDKDYNGIDHITTQGDGGAGKPKTLHFDRLYWLGQIEYAYRRRKRLSSKDPSAPSTPSTICIQTHAEEALEARQSTLGAETCAHVLEEHFVSLSTKAGTPRHYDLRVDGLIAQIRELAQGQSPIKATGEEIKLHDYIKAQQSKQDDGAYRATKVKDLLGKAGVSDATGGRWHRYLEQLSRRGEVLYYIEHEELRDYVWLSPSATVAYIHRHILGSKHICRGELPLGFFDSLAQSEEDKEEDRRLGLLLEREQAIFRGGARGYIVPGYLPLREESPDSEWLTMGLGRAHLQLYFARFIPFGLINQLICHYGREGHLVKYYRDQILFTIGLDTSQDEKTRSEGSRDEPTKPRYRLARQDDYKVWIRLDLSQRLISVAICPIREREDKSETRQHLERIILDDLLRLYWGGSTDRPKREPIDDLYLTYMGEGERASEPLFVHLATLDNEGKTTQGRILAYPLTKRAGGAGHPKRLVLDREKGREVSTRPYQHLSTNKHLSTLKRVFISYSKADRDELQECLKYLYPLQRSGKIEVYYDELTSFSERIHDSIRRHLLEADCMIALVSQDYLNTLYVLDKELPVAIREEKDIVPIQIKPCTWQDNPELFDRYFALKARIINCSPSDTIPHIHDAKGAEAQRASNWVAFIEEFKKKLNIQ